jgi:hypothetical protein
MTAAEPQESDTNPGPTPGETGDDIQPSMAPDLSPRWLVWSGLIGIVLIAIGSGIGRMLRLREIPPGLMDAELDHALLARQASDFGIQWAIENAGPLSIPLVLLITAIGTITGFDVETPRIAAAIFGAGSILFTGLWIMRAMGPLWGLAAAALLAGSFWHILFSRMAIGTISATFALAAFCWLLTEAGTRQGPAARPWYLLAGIAAGVGFLSAPGLRLLPLVLIGVLAYTFYNNRTSADSSAPTGNWLTAAIAALLAISPALIAQRNGLSQFAPWATTPGLPGNDQISIPTLATAIIDTATGLVLPSDGYTDANLPGNAWFSILLLPWALAGLIGLIRIWNRPDLQAHFSVGIAVLVSVLIGISAVDAGHPAQLTILSPALVAVATVGFRTLINWARVTTVKYALASLVIVGIAGQAAISIQTYVDDWATTPETAEALNANVIDALLATVHLDTEDPVIFQANSAGTARDYFRPPGRIHLQSDPDLLMFPATESGYLIATSPDFPLESLLAQSSLPTEIRDGSGISIFRLDDRIREHMPLSAPTVQFPNGPSFQGVSSLSRIDVDHASVLIAWRSPASVDESFTIDVQLRTAEAFPITTEAEAVLPPSPLQGDVYQVLRIELELPERDGAIDLEVRLRREDGSIVPVGGMDDDGFLFLNRYRLER